MKLRLFGVVFTFLAHGFSVANSQAAVIISPIVAAASSEYSPVYGIGNTIDQSGLSLGSGFASGVTDFDSYIAGNPTHKISAPDAEWFTAPGVTTATVNYDLGNLYSIDRLALWNEETTGIDSFDMSLSVDNVNFTTVASGLTPAVNGPTSPYSAEIFDFGPQIARYIQFDINSCLRRDGSPSNVCGIGEVAFSASIVPIPPAAWFFGCGLLGLIGIARRNRNKAA